MNETRIKHLDALIAEVGGALRYQSIQYHLFGDDQKVSVLENTCPEIWHAIQDGLFDATVAAVGRLCDKDGNPGMGNITVYAVAKELDSSGNLQKRVYESLKPTTKLRKNLIRFRHKTVAHADAATRLGHSVEGSGFRLSEIDDVIKSMMAAVMVNGG